MNSVLLEVFEVPQLPEVLEAMRRVLLCMLEDAEGELCFAGGVRGTAGTGGAGGDVLCASLYAGGRGGERSLLLRIAGGDAMCATPYAVMRCVLLRMLEAVEGERCLLLRMLVVMRCVLLRMLEVMRRVLLCMLEAHCRGFEIFVVAVFSSQSATYEFTREYLPVEIECKVMACGRMSLR